jgi:nitrogen fixation protein NifB
MNTSPALSPAAVARIHPCFDEQAHERMARVHLPVAPRCNIRCRFCERRVCANLTVQHPGWTRELLSPEQAFELVHRLAHSWCGESTEDYPFVVGVAGPGEPLTNAGTFEALARVHESFPALVKCVSTNGLLLEQELPHLLDVGVRAITVTVNAPDGAVGQHIYAWVRYQEVTYRGREAAEILIASQLRGIQAALGAGLALKVNTVLIPGVNDRHVVRLARLLSELGVSLMNIMPLIPGGQMKDRRAPTCDELGQARSDCGQWVPQVRWCEQCRADVIRTPQCSS